MGYSYYNMHLFKCAVTSAWNVPVVVTTSLRFIGDRICFVDRNVPHAWWGGKKIAAVVE